MSVIVHHGDSREVLKTLADASVDAVVCDPPYALVSIGKSFGKEGAAPAKVGKSGAYARASAGFMGKKWDTGETAFDPEFWVEVLRVLKPGGHLIAFSGTRTYHRLACAIEDAGFEMRDMCAWNYGSGFPKSHNVIKRLVESGSACACPKTIISSHHVRHENLRDLQRGLDSANALSGGPEQDMRGYLHGQGGERQSAGALAKGSALDRVSDMRDCVSPTPVTRREEQGGLLQPIVPIQDVRRTLATDGGEHEGPEGQVVFRSDEPGLEGRRDAQAPEGELQGRALHQSAGMGEADGEGRRLHHGASAGDGADVRVPADADGGRGSRGSQPGEQRTGEPEALPDQRGPQAWGGWPVCPGCLQPIVPEGYGTALKPAFEPIVLARRPISEANIAANVLAHGTGALNIDGCRVEGAFESGWSKSGSKASDNVAMSGANYERAPKPDSEKGRWPANVLHDGSDEVISAFPLTESGVMRAGTRRAAQDGPGSVVYGTYGGDATSADTPGDSGSAARFFYSAKADAEDRCGSKHPTVKPVDLMAWLCRLVTPPGGVILDPFAGSGSTGIAAMREGFDCILVEREAEYVADIHRRVAWATGEGRLTVLEQARDFCPAAAAGEDLPLFATQETAQPASQPASVSSTGHSPATPDRADGDDEMVAA